ncbi:hypothetical protein BCR39DRAFT_551262 [Naematelia encephala]|uniref:Uncharacterized protein n=1 Tax=Naematelia encephala TaxID=71784 RepID=A0A1Y2AJ17_9TREE|nr:hypothetical protein BCR39DRAFT_551262 [Naematelia encephala]
MKGTVCTVPKSCILSHQTASFSTIHPLPLNADEEFQSSDYILHLAACLLHELRLGEASRWYGYLQILPRSIVMIPTFWEVEELAGLDGAKALEWLRGTEGDKELRRKVGDGLGMAAIQEYYSAIQSFFPSTPSHPCPSPFSAYVYALSMVSTRAFVLDAYHTIGIIPFVDLFNHSSTSHTSLLCDQNVCPTCGSILACEHDLDLDAKLGSSDEPETPQRLAHLSVNYIQRPEAEGNNVDMCAERPIRAGEEIFSCYEEDVGDGKLLVEWGYVSGEQAGEGLTWSPRDVIRPNQVGLFMALLQSEKMAAAVEADRREEDLLPPIPTDPTRSVGKGVKPATSGTSPNSVTAPKLIAPASTKQFGLLNVTHNGLVSINLLIAMYLRTLPDSIDGDLDRIESDLVIVFNELEAAARHREMTLTSRNDNGLTKYKDDRQYTMKSGTSRLGHAVVRLVEERLEATFKPELSAEDLRMIHYALPTDAILQRTALVLAEDERRLLEVVKARWIPLLGGSV